MMILVFISSFIYLDDNNLLKKVVNESMVASYYQCLDIVDNVFILDNESFEINFFNYIELNLVNKELYSYINYEFQYEENKVSIDVNYKKIFFKQYLKFEIGD